MGRRSTDPPDPNIPPGVVPSFLSNSVVETYLQTFVDTNPKDPNAPFSNGSCVTCHRAATLSVGANPSSNLSFLPQLAQPGLVRRKPLTAGP